MPYNPPVPSGPGAYQLLDDSGVVVYVGHAKDLSERLESWLNNPRQNPLVASHWGYSRRVTYKVTQTENDAVHLEQVWYQQYLPVCNRIVP